MASPGGRVAGSFLGIVCGGCAIAFITARMLIAHAQYSAWERSSKFDPTGFYQGRFLVVTVALLATPILIVFFSARLRDDSPARWTTATGGLLGLGVGMGSWFLLLGLRTPPTYLFVWTGALIAVAGTVAGTIGVRAAVRAGGGRADLDSSAEWLKRRRLLKTGAAVALLGSVGIVVSSLFAASAANAVDPRNSFLTLAAQLAPAVVVMAFGACLALGFENRWEIATGAWLGIGLSVGLAYLCVGVVYLFQPALLAMALSGFAVAIGGDVAKEAAETLSRAEHAAYAEVTPPDPQPHVHHGPVAGDLGLHLRNVHGRLDLPAPLEDKAMMHDDLHTPSALEKST